MNYDDLILLSMIARHLHVYCLLLSIRLFGIDSAQINIHLSYPTSRPALLCISLCNHANKDVFFFIS